MIGAIPASRLPVRFMDARRLGPAQRAHSPLGAARPGNPRVNETGMLTGAEVVGMINPTGKNEIVARAASAFDPGEDAVAGRLKKLKLNGPAALLPK